MEQIIGQVQIFAFGFAPAQWAFCDGQLMAIQQNTALFSLLGTTYGGNGQTTFGLPDLRGRTAVHPGTGPGLTNIQWGQVGGTETVSLITSNLPALPPHTHNFNVKVSDAVGDTNVAAGAYLSKGISSGSGPNKTILKSFTNTATPLSSLATQATEANTPAGGGNSAPFAIRSPYLGIYYSIALYGIFPSRN